MAWISNLIKRYKKKFDGIINEDNLIWFLMWKKVKSVSHLKVHLSVKRNNEISSTAHTFLVGEERNFTQKVIKCDD